MFRHFIFIVTPWENELLDVASSVSSYFCELRLDVGKDDELEAELLGSLRALCVNRL